MVNRKLEKAEWKNFFEFFSKLLEGKHAEIEVASLDFGDQIAAEWLPLGGIVYDPKDDIVQVILEPNPYRDEIDHIISKPREIYFAEEAGQFMGFDIVDSRGTHQIVKLKDALMLPSPPH